MNNPIHKFSIISLTGIIVGLCLLQFLFQGVIFTPAISLVITILVLMMTGLYEKVYEDGTGRPRDLAEIPQNVPHRVVFEHKLGNGESVFGLRPHAISLENKALIPDQEIIVYCGKLPASKQSGAKPEFIICLHMESGLEFEEVHLNGFRVHGE